MIVDPAGQAWSEGAGMEQLVSADQLATSCTVRPWGFGSSRRSVNRRFVSCEAPVRMFAVAVL